MRCEKQCAEPNLVAAVQHLDHAPQRQDLDVRGISEYTPEEPKSEMLGNVFLAYTIV